MGSQEKETKEEKSKAKNKWSSLLDPFKVIRDAVHGDFWITEFEARIIDTEVFQRLHNIRQLATAYLVYPNAKHTRFEHSLGALYIATKIIEAVQRNYTNREIIIGDLLKILQAKGYSVFSLDDRDIVLTRIAALLHDAAHLPFGHILEKEGNLISLSQWADERRLKYFFEDCKMEQIIKNFLKEKGFQDYECDEFVEELKSILRAIEGADPQKGEPIVDENPEDEAIKKLDHPYIGDIVGNTLCADLFDYVLRDAYFTGLKLSTELRIINNFAIIGKSKKEARLTLLLVRKGLYRQDTLSDAIQFLRQRYFIAERVYYHRVKAAASAMLMRAIYEYYHKCLNKSLDNDEVLKELMEIGDDTLIYKLLEDSKKTLLENLEKVILNKIKNNEKLTPDEQELYDKYIEKGKKIKSFPINFFEKYENIKNLDEKHKQWASIFNLLTKFKKRELHKPVYMVYTRRGSRDKAKLDDIIENYTNPEARHEFERYLEDLLHLPPGSVILYITKRERGKAGKASCLWIDGNIKTIEKLDEEVDGLNGEFSSLKGKYEGLWKLYVFMSRDLLNIKEVKEYAVAFCKNKLYPINDLEYKDEIAPKTEGEIFIEYIAPKEYPNIQLTQSQIKLYLNNINKFYEERRREMKSLNFVPIEVLKEKFKEIIKQ